MRRFPVLLVAAVAALSPVSAASARSSPSSEEMPEACPAPDMLAKYDADRFAVWVSLPTQGCPTRENGDFYMSLWLDRVDEHTGEGHGRVVPCGPFDSSSDAGADTPDRWDTCELDMWIGHPSPEAASYDLTVTFPGADGEETLEFHWFCTTGDDGVFCSDADGHSEQPR